MLLRQGVEADFKVKPTGQADFAHGAKRFRVIAFSKQASKLILESHGLNSDAALDMSKLAHSSDESGPNPKTDQQAAPSQPHKTEPDERPSLKPAQSKNRSRKQQSEPDQQLLKPEQQADPSQTQSSKPDQDSVHECSNDARVSVSEIIHTFDLYISVNLQMYSAQLVICDEGISIRYPSVIFSDACKSTSLQEHWWAKVRRMGKISVGDNSIHFSRSLMPKTFAALNQYMESNSEG